MALSVVLSPSALAAEVLVAVSANFAAPLARIAEDFRAATGHVVLASSGPTGRFATQIAAGGAPYQVLLAGDQETAARLVAQGHAVAGTRFTYAVGRLALWSATPGRIDADGAVLAGDGFRRLAIANPKVAPYGRAAVEVMRARGLHEALAPRLVTGESVAQAYQFVASGNAELGFVALAQLRQTPATAAGSMWLVPASLHAPIRQDAVLLAVGRDSAAARALLDFLRGPRAAAVIEAYGYER